MSVRRSVNDLFDDASDLALVVGLLAGVWVVMTLFAALVGGDAWPNLAAGFVGRVTVLVGAYALLVMALNLQWGYTGLFNIGVAGFMAVGAYTTAILSAPVDPGSSGVPGFGLPLLVAMLGGMLAAAVVGALAALPALRLKADYLAIVTVALSEIIRLFVNWEGVASLSVLGKTFGTGGGTGLSFPSPRDVFSAFFAGPGNALIDAFGAVGVSGPNVVTIAYGLALLALVAVTYWVFARIVRSPFGRVLKAIREDEIVAQSLGKDTTAFKIKVFMIGCAMMGLAGALYRGQAGYISPDQFRPSITFYVFAALIIGGAGSNTGSVLGAATFSALLFYLPSRFGEYVPVGQGDTPGNVIQALAPLGSLDPVPLVAFVVANVSTLRFVLIGVVLILVVQYRPEGLLGHRVEQAASVDLATRPESSRFSGGASDE